MSDESEHSPDPAKQGLPSRRGCILLVALVLLAIGIPVGLWAAGPLSARIATATHPETAAIQRTCREGIALSLQLAAVPEGYAADAVVPQAVRDTQVSRAEQKLPEYFVGRLLQSQLATYRTQLNQGNFVPNTHLISMTFKRLSVHGTTATTSGVARFGQDGDHALQWDETFTIELIKQDGRWLITGMDLKA